MKIVFIYPDFERHARSHPELREHVPCKEYLGPPSLGIAGVAAATPEGIEVEFVDDRVTPFDPNTEADLFALSFFTPAATRGLEIAAQLKALGKKVAAGGVFPSLMPQACKPFVDSAIIGEGEAVWPQVVADAMAGALKPIYKADAPVDPCKLKPPRLDLYINAETDGHRPDDYPLQISRGCPFSCPACALPTSMGSKIRFLPEDLVVKTAAIYAQAGKRCSLTEDTSFMPFSGAKRKLSKLLERVISLKNQVEIKFSYIGTSLPLILTASADLIELTQRAGIGKYYLVCGFDPISRKAFGEGDKKAVEQALKAVEICRDHGIDPYMSLLAGNPEDDEGVFDRILEFTEKAKIERAEFVIATPYPGTPIWKKYLEEGRIIHRTWKKYNDANVVFTPHKMSPEKLLDGYLMMWKEFYKGKGHLAGETSSLNTVQF